MISSYVFFVVLAAIIVVAASYGYFYYKTGCPTFPTLPAMRRRMINVLEQDAKTSNSNSYTVMDLGSGSGQLCRGIAMAMPNARVIGVELSWVPWIRSVVRQALFGPTNIEYRRTDFWSCDISKVDAVIIYLMDSQMEQLSEKLRKELKPGALIMASKRSLRGDWKPFKTYDIELPKAVTFLPLPMTLWLYRQAAAANLNTMSAFQSLEETQLVDDVETSLTPESSHAPEKTLYARVGA